MKRFIAAVIVVLALNPVVGSPRVHFADPDLKAAVESELGATNPTASNMLGLTYLAVSFRHYVTSVQYEQGERLLKSHDGELDEIKARQKRVYSDLAAGRLAPEYLQAVLDSVETPDLVKPRSGRQGTQSQTGAKTADGPVIDERGDNLYVTVADYEPVRLCDPTRRILAKLHHPIDVKLYYAKSAVEGVQGIKYNFSHYFETVLKLLKGYEATSNGMIRLHVIDPEPYSQAEQEAINLDLKKYALSQEENFFFGLVVETQGGVKKTIPILAPGRQHFLEYDITALIDMAIMPERKRIGILSSLPVFGDDVSGYMIQMMKHQGQAPTPAWTFVEQLRQRYQVEKVPTNVAEIGDIDLLMVIHPKNLDDRTLFAIDQFVLKGGRAVICVDPHSFADRPPKQTQIKEQMEYSSSSEMNELFNSWGLRMPANTFAGDMSLAAMASVRKDQEPEKIIGYLNLTSDGGCFTKDNIVTTELDQVKVLFAGVLSETVGSEAASSANSRIKRTPLIKTTERGNAFEIESQHEMMFLDGSRLMKKFVDGTKPVSMGYLITGPLRSSFPDGIEVKEASLKPNSPAETTTASVRVTGLTEAVRNCTVAVFSDVDFITDALAYQTSFFGKTVVGDNSTLMLNTIDALLGSDEQIEMLDCKIHHQPRNFVQEIRHRVESEYERRLKEPTEKVNSQIAEFEAEIKQLTDSAKKDGQAEIVSAAILSKKAELEGKINKVKATLNGLKRERYEKKKQIERLTKDLKGFNIPLSLIEEIDIKDLESLILNIEPNTVRLKRKGKGTIIITREISYRSSSPENQTFAGPLSERESKSVLAPLIQGLDTSQIAFIEIAVDGNKNVLKRQEDKFVLPSKGEYPANTETVNRLLRMCTDIVVSGSITDKIQDHKSLGVTLEDADTFVKFLKEDRSLLAGLVVGKSDPQGLGRFVRSLPSASVYVTQEVPSIGEDIIQFVDQELLTLHIDDVNSVKVISIEGKHTLVPQKDGSIAIREGTHAGKNVNDNVIKILCNLSFVDIIRKEGIQNESNFSHVYILGMKDSTEYVCLVSQRNNDIFVAITSDFTDKNPVTIKPGEVESPDALRAKEAKLIAKKHAMNFSKKHKGWLYRISKESGRHLIQRIESLIE